MENTLKLMKSILNGKEKDTNENELIIQYKETLFPNILAYFYVNNFGLIKRISQLYPQLLHEDIASFSLQELDNCLQKFDSSMQIKFTTYFAKCLKNRLRAEIEALHAQKRKALLNYSSLDAINDTYSIDLEIEDIDYILDYYNLNYIDKLQCKLVYYGYSLKEVASILRQATITIYKRNSTIRQKILN